MGYCKDMALLRPHRPQDDSTAPPAAVSRHLWPRLFGGAAVGWFTAQALLILGVDWWFQDATGVLGGLLAVWFAYLWRRRFRAAPLALCGVLWLIVLVVQCTPVIGYVIERYARVDKLRPADAVVVLNADVLPNGHPSVTLQHRLDHAYDVLRGGYAPWLVVTRLAPPRVSVVPTVRVQMRQHGLHQGVAETGYVLNTHDEAQQVRALTQARGWRHIILVTDRVHMRRAEALMRKTGLDVTCSPCLADTDALSLSTMEGRNAAFRYWFHECTHLLSHKLRGWI